MVGGDDPESRRERLGGHRRERLEPRGKDEQVRRLVVARELPVVDEAEERHRARELELRDEGLELASRLALPGDPELRIGNASQHLRHRLDDEALAGERVEALDVEEQRPRPSPSVSRAAALLFGSR